jgi:predicted acetyltransferase
MNHKIEIHSAKNLSSERSLELGRWFDKEFGKLPFHWAEPNWYVLALFDSKLLGRLGIVERKVSINEYLFDIAGISGVVTGDQWRGSGIATDMLKSAMEFIHNQLNISYCLLLCRSQVAPFYAKLGWKVALRALISLPVRRFFPGSR